ncbi:alkyl sulfatase C-terminal domain-containing protein [Streptomyces sp. NPDC001904]|uniref:alkyl sulfatase C-terminal domain-containing protein n=1 Tax=Streptomyces sp. NPDC001904 TaxID=3154531 RepID=UPI00331948C3
MPANCSPAPSNSSATHAENGTWRTFYLSGTTELREGRFGTPTVTASADIAAHLTPTTLFDALSIQVDGPLAWDKNLTVDVHLTDVDERYRLRLVNRALSHTAAPQKTEPARRGRPFRCPGREGIPELP